MKLEDAIFNWLSMNVMIKKYPDDRAAIETEKLFKEILYKDFQVNQINVFERDSSIKVIAHISNEEYHYQFPKELVYFLSYQLEHLNREKVTTNHLRKFEDD